MRAKRNHFKWIPFVPANAMGRYKWNRSNTIFPAKLTRRSIVNYKKEWIPIFLYFHTSTMYCIMPLDLYSTLFVTCRESAAGFLWFISFFVWFFSLLLYVCIWRFVEPQQQQERQQIKMHVKTFLPDDVDRRNGQNLIRIAIFSCCFLFLYLWTIYNTIELVETVQKTGKIDIPWNLFMFQLNKSTSHQLKAIVEKRFSFAPTINHNFFCSANWPTTPNSSLSDSIPFTFQHFNCLFFPFCFCISQ